MKPILPVICLLCVAKVVSAQPPSVTVDTTYKILPDAKRNSLLSQGSFSHNTSKGKVYTLPPDNMPCLVPDMQKVVPMPGSYQKAPQNRMPNILPRRELIPKNKKQE